MLNVGRFVFQTYLVFSVTKMKQNICRMSIALLTLALNLPGQMATARDTNSSKTSSASATAAGTPIDFFEAVDSGRVNAKFIALNDHAAKLIVTNNTKQPLSLKLPDAFAGVPI